MASRPVLGWVLFALLMALQLMAGGAAADTLLVANRNDDRLSFISLADGREIARVNTGLSPHEVEIDPSGRWAMVSNYGTTDEPGSSLTRIDLQTREVSTLELGIGTRPHGIAWLPDGRHLLVTSEGDQSVAWVDFDAMKRMASIPTPGKQPHMIVVDAAGRWAWITNVMSGSISKIDLRTREVVASASAGEGAEGIALDSQRRLWTAANGDGSVRVFDADTLAQLEQIEVGGMAIRVELAEAHHAALVTSAVSGQITVIDTRSLKIRRRVSTRWHTSLRGGRFLAGFFGILPVPVGAQLSHSGDSFFVANSFGGVVVEYSLTDFEVLRLLEAGREPDGMAVFDSSEFPAGH